MSELTEFPLQPSHTLWLPLKIDCVSGGKHLVVITNAVAQESPDGT